MKGRVLSPDVLSTSLRAQRIRTSLEMPVSHMKSQCSYGAEFIRGNEFKFWIQYIYYCLSTFPYLIAFEGTCFDTLSVCLGGLEAECFTASSLPLADSHAVPPVAQVLPTRCHTFWSDCNSFSRWQSRAFGERKCLWCNVAILSFVYAGRQSRGTFFCKQMERLYLRKED